MEDVPLTTKYAPPERASNEIIKKQIKIFENNEVLNRFLNKVPAIFIIVNEYRQVVYMNNGALEFTGLDDLTSIIGKRPGEIFECIHASEEEAGCGTSEACTYCGAVNVVLSSQKGKPTVEDCRLTCAPNDTSYDLRVWASPLEINGEQFTAITIQDIQHEKRRENYEQIFFHDIMNTINGLSSALQLLLDYGDRVDQEEYLKKINYFTDNLIEEVQFHRMLTSAESKSLSLNPIKFNSIDFLNEMVNSYINHSIAKDKTIFIDPSSESVNITIDRTVLRRILRNMINNALEAIQEGGEVTLGCNVKDENVEFWVHNPGIIPREAELQVFQRSFSTKGRNRGLGTYSMKLFSSFLNGSINFSSSEEKGTVFKASYPIRN